MKRKLLGWMLGMAMVLTMASCGNNSAPSGGSAPESSEGGSASDLSAEGSAAENSDEGGQ